MARPVTLFTAMWSDKPLEEVAKKAADLGYDGLELVCWGKILDPNRGATDMEYCKERLAILEKYNLKVYAISNHLAGQLVCDPNNDSRSDTLAPPQCHGDADKKRRWGVETMKNTARTAKNLGVKVVNGFTGSSIWHLFFCFPPVASDEVINGILDDGFSYFAKMWNPILDVFDECGVKFALEVHPCEIAFDVITFERALMAVGNRKAFGYNFDPSHLYWQMTDPVRLLMEFPDRINHVHMKDAQLRLNGRGSILASHLNFGHPDRAWDFCSLGRGGVNFDEIIRAFNQIGYTGPLSVEWEDLAMSSEHGVKEALEFVRKIDFEPSK